MVKNNIVVNGVFCPPREKMALNRYQQLIDRLEAEQDTCMYHDMNLEVDDDDWLIIQIGGDKDTQISLPCGPLRKLLREASERENPKKEE